MTPQEMLERDREAMLQFNIDFVEKFFATNPYLPADGRTKSFANLSQPKGVELVKTWSIETSPGLLITGPSGCGKTHAMIALMNNIMAKIAQTHHLSTKYVHWTNPLQMLEKLRGEANRANTMALLESCHYLFIDDLGCESLTEWGLEQMYHVLEVRKNKQLPTFITTNLNVDELKRKYHERFLSRLREGFLFVQMSGDDYRTKILNERMKVALTKAKGVGDGN